MPCVGCPARGMTAGIAVPVGPKVTPGGAGRTTPGTPAGIGTLWALAGAIWPRTAETAGVPPLGAKLEIFAVLADEEELPSGATYPGGGEGGNPTAAGGGCEDEEDDEEEAGGATGAELTVTGTGAAALLVGVADNVVGSGRVGTAAAALEPTGAIATVGGAPVVSGSAAVAVGSAGTGVQTGSGVGLAVAVAVAGASPSKRPIIAAVVGVAVGAIGVGDGDAVPLAAVVTVGNGVGVRHPGGTSVAAPAESIDQPRKRTSIPAVSAVPKMTINRCLPLCPCIPLPHVPCRTCTARTPCPILPSFVKSRDRPNRKRLSQVPCYGHDSDAHAAFMFLDAPGSA
jgi:hypothetical protein